MLTLLVFASQVAWFNYFLFGSGYYLSIELLWRWHRSNVELLLGFTDAKTTAEHTICQQ
jgi:hypothetical protein